MGLISLKTIYSFIKKPFTIQQKTAVLISKGKVAPTKKHQLHLKEVVDALMHLLAE